MQADNISIVLVEPSHPGNVGAVARAMKNMGLAKLVLVAPERFPDQEATWRAVSARDVLEHATVVPTLEQALADAQLVVAATARDRRIPWPVLDARRACADIAAQSSSSRVAIVFGREDNGLSNEELMHCNMHLAIPTSEAYTSMNLAMAVQVVCYELFMCATGDGLPTDAHANWDAPMATQENLERFYTHLEETLIQIDFLNPSAPRQLMQRLRRLYGRLRLDEMEVNILRGILTETQKCIGTHERSPRQDSPGQAAPDGGAEVASP